MFAFGAGVSLIAGYLVYLAYVVGGPEVGEEERAFEVAINASR